MKQIDIVIDNQFIMISSLSLEVSFNHYPSLLQKTKQTKNNEFILYIVLVRDLKTKKTLVHIKILIRLQMPKVGVFYTNSTSKGKKTATTKNCLHAIKSRKKFI